ncbi:MULTISPECIES: hypothetical protein [Streptomyces]|uniref:hypothetical protein n=1 Tax=Streptomyces TaxID=1883 RepID=UPI0004BDFFED|nr:MULTISPECIES: hypothetical protein [Streptomyces]KOG81227.1 hypothetical protein ADK33_15570 [Streptomyces griseus subsp. rhodochrous]
MTGVLGLMKGRQDAADKERDRLEGRRARRIETRHTAYTAFIAQSRSAALALSAATEVKVSAADETWNDAITEALNASEEMYHGYVELALAGPPPLAQEAELLWLRAIRAANQVETLWSRRDPTDQVATVASLLGDEDPDRMGDFIQQQKKLIELAREQLGGDVVDR